MPLTPDAWKQAIPSSCYKFLYVGVGANGSESGGCVFTQTLEMLAYEKQTFPALRPDQMQQMEPLQIIPEFAMMSSLCGTILYSRTAKEAWTVRNGYTTQN